MRVAMDLAGPKLRTGPLEPGPSVVRIRPRRDVYGRVTVPARVWLTPSSFPQPAPSPASACLQLPTAWIARLRTGERVKFTDARDSTRSLKIVEVTNHGCWAEETQTAYIVPGVILRHDREVEEADQREGSVGNVPPVENAILLKQGDRLILTRDLRPGRPATYDKGGQILRSMIFSDASRTITARNARCSAI
jgi:pyruvate kinase